MRRVRRERIHGVRAIRVGNLFDEGNVFRIENGLRRGDLSPKPFQFKAFSTLPTRISIALSMSTRRSSFLLSSAGRGGTVDEVAVALIVVVESGTSTMVAVGAAGAGVTTEAETLVLRIWLVRRERQTLLQ